MALKLVASTVDPPIGGLLVASYIKPDIVVNVEWGKETLLQVQNFSFNTSNSVSRYLARIVPAHGLYGASVLENVEVDHWLSYSIGPMLCDQEFKETILYLNRVISNRTYLVGSKLTIADFAVFGALYSNPQWSSLVQSIDKTTTNVNRWYELVKSLDHVQSVLRSLPALAKSKPVAEVTTGGRKEEGKFVDLPGAEMGKVVVRFPPEASGYLHIGHAKAALLNQYYQETFKGKLIMRFDDTNPAKEKVDFEKVILEDLKMLEIKPDQFTHTSQYFDLMLNYCERLIKEGKAYVDDTAPETMKEEREQRTKSKNWNNSLQQNLKLWEEMKRGSAVGQKCCVRAKIDMDSPNGCMRDPTIYRCKNEPHPRTGTQYKVYPTYDFACPIVDSIEGVTHCLRTTEYVDRDDQFYWFIDSLGLRKPYIWSYSRLNMMNTVLSKRKLTWFVDEKIVDNWDDPRFPTVRGVLRRGMTVEGLKQFIIAQGGSRSVVMMEWDKIWAINKKVIDPIASRYTAVVKEKYVRVTVAGAKEEGLVVAKHPKNADVGNKTVWTAPTILIDAADAELLKEGENSTFINWGNLLIKKVIRNGGKVVSVEAEPNLSNTDYKKTLKLTWLAETAKAPLLPCLCVYFDNIISKAVLGKDDDFKQFTGHTTKVEIEMLGDPELANLKENDVIQLQRKGFFRCERPYSPTSVHTFCDAPVILYFIPDGSKSGALNIIGTVVGAKQKDTAKPAVKASEPKSGIKADDISSKIAAQGDRVRQLKSEKASKDAIGAEVKALLELKSQFRTLTGTDWKPDAQNISLEGPSAVNVPNVCTGGAGDQGILVQKIADQGNQVRDLKTSKSAKDVIDEAVKTLLDLKKQYKQLTGTDYVVPGAKAPSKKKEVKDKAEKVVNAPEPKSGTMTADDISSKIAAQGDRVRQLKSEKASKDAITAEVQALLVLKSQYKVLTGKDWKPDAQIPSSGGQSAVTASNTTAQVGSGSDVDISSKIAAQGDRVRQLKSEKASKDAITAEVQALLTLKSQYKALTGKDWKPDAQNPSSGGQSAVTASNTTARVGSGSDVDISSKIAAQGDRVRQLKSEKASKDAITAEVQALLALKSQYKALTGKDWKPDAQNPSSGGQSAVTASNTTAQVGSGIDVDISSKIAAQGDRVRQLKSEKASKDAITAEVQALLALKSQYKALTGKDWKPDAQNPSSGGQSVVNVPNVMTEVSSRGNGEQDVLVQKIIDQGNQVRDLKTSKGTKDTIDQAVKSLLDLKGQYKQLTGTDYVVPGARAPSKKKEVKEIVAPTKKKEVKEKAVPQKKAGSVEKDGSQGGLKKQTRLGLEATKEENLPDWYSQVITKGELIEYYDVSGCYILRPWSFAIWEFIQSFIDGEIKKLGVQNCYFPIFVSKAALEKEKTHIADFAPEVAWVTKSGESDLAEHIAVRPTSETGMYPAYAKWIQSYRDLPIKLNQWNNVVRWEFKHPQPFLRTREFLWQEGHTAFATLKEAEEEVHTILDIYARVYTDLLAIPVIKGRKTEKEKFAGGDFTTTVEAFVSASGRAIQGATSHHLGQNFAKMFEIVFEDPETQEKQYVFQNSWGLTTRTIGVMIMVHADNQGLVLPPRIACIQVVITPCGVTASLSEADKKSLLASCEELEKSLKDAGVRVRGDYRDNYSPGWKFNHWELKGVPIRVELGPKDLQQKQLVAVRRDTGEKVTLKRESAVGDLAALLETIHRSMYDKASKELESHTVICKDWSAFCGHLESKKIIIAPFCGEIPCEDRIKLDSARDDAEAESGAPAMGAKSLCIPFDQPAAITASDRCIHSACSNKPKKYTLFGRSY